MGNQARTEAQREPVVEMGRRKVLHSLGLTTAALSLLSSVDGNPATWALEGKRNPSKWNGKYVDELHMGCYRTMIGGYNGTRGKLEGIDDAAGNDECKTGADVFKWSLPINLASAQA